MPLSFGAQLGEKGWQAGAVIPMAMVPVLVPHMTRLGQAEPEVAATDWLVVISQTCDVVHAKLENEPWIEVLHCRPQVQLRPDFQGRKSTRRLDFRPDKENHEAVVLSAHATVDRYVAPRALFLEHAPDPNRRLSDKAVANLQQWYALRYTRPAWPDALVARLNKGKKKLVAALKVLTFDDVEVRVAIAERDDELADEQSYHVAVFFVVDQIVWDADVEAREMTQMAFAEFVSALGACKGVAINQELSDVYSGDDFSWQMTKTTDEWNFANLSEQE